MKKNLFALFIALLSVGQVFGGTYYAKLKATSSVPADGLVYASTSTSEPAKSNYGSTKTSGNNKASGLSSSATVSLYAFAQPVRGKKFASWTPEDSKTKVKANTGIADEITISSDQTAQDQNKVVASVIANWTDDSQYTITLKKPQHGSITIKATYYTIVSNKLTEKSSEEAISSTADEDAIQFTAYQADKITLSASEGDDGSSFVAWYTIAGEDTTLLTYDREYTGYFDSDKTFYALIAPANESNFLIFNPNDAATSKGLPSDFYGDLSSAIEAAQASQDKKCIVLVKEKYTLTESCTIPQGVTLLIPFDDALSCNLEYPEILNGKTYSDADGIDPRKDKSKVYRTLTLSQGTNLFVDGSICINAKRWTVINSGSNDGEPPFKDAQPSGTNRVHMGFGLINMGNNSSIQVKSGGKLYCWGRIRGEGTITAQSGSEVRECFVFTDWRNNNFLSDYAQYTRCFPMNQYYIQDIQVPITYESGASSILVAAIFYSTNNPVGKGVMNFVGTPNSNSLIELPTGATMTKKYVASEDRLYIDMENGASFNNFQLSISIPGFNLSAATNSHIFTITNNWTVNINSGTTNMTYDLAWAPGSILNIKQGASVTMLEGMSMYVYDHDDWGDFAAGRRIQPLMKPSQEASYEVTVKVRTYEVDCPDAELIINGTLTVVGGENKVFKTTGGLVKAKPESFKSGLYTTDGGANIHGTGIVVYEQGSGDQIETQQLNLTSNYNSGDKDVIDYYSYPLETYGHGMARPKITPAKLKNDNGSYTETKDFTSETTFVYENGTWIAKIETIDIEEATYTVPSGNKIEATDITIHEGATLDVATDASLTVTGTLVINASEDNSGDLPAADKIKIDENANVYFDYSFNTPAMRWNAIAFPWQVDATSGVKVGATALTLGRDFDIIYYDGATRAEQGPVDDCWRYVEDDDDKTLVLGRLYMILFAQPQTVVRFAKKAGTPLKNVAPINVEQYGEGGTNANWNGIANPALYHAYLGAGVDEGQVYNNAEDSYSTITLASYSLPVGKPVFVQAETAQTVVVNKSQSSNAPAYFAANENTSLRTEVELRNDNNVVTDKVILCMDEDALDKYTIGSDLAKAGVSSKVAQLWVNRYGTQLCKNTIAPIDDIADYPLTIFAPTTGEYTLVPNIATHSGYTLYLTYAGAAFAELTDYGYTLELTKGNNSDYGLRLIKKQSGVVTSLDETLMLKDVQKVIYQGNLYIIRNKRVYNAAGQLIK